MPSCELGPVPECNLRALGPRAGVGTGNGGRVGGVGGRGVGGGRGGGALGLLLAQRMHVGWRRFLYKTEKGSQRYGYS